MAQVLSDYVSVEGGFVLFPNRFPDLLTPSVTMAGALTAAQATAALTFPSAGVHLNPISVAAVINPTSSPSFVYAGFGDTDMHYSASVLKVAAMLAAFELRQSASDFALTEGDCTPSIVFDDLKNAFNQSIDNSAPRFLAEPGVTQQMRVPKYSTIFGSPQGLASGGCDMSFSQTFADNIRDMIVPSDDIKAAKSIQALGYSWINGLLMKVGLFDQNTNQGIWLAGTFAGDLNNNPGNASLWPYVRIPSVNDGPSAQATTTIDMVRLFALTLEGDVLDSRSIDGISSDMRKLLSDAQSVGDSSFMTTGARPGINGLGPGFTITHSKIGLGPLKAGGDVASEATILNHDGTGQQFIVVWQNLRNLNDRHNAMSFMVRRTILNFLGIP